ncbi:MAG: L,D-transpeptidase family protein [Bdellovibrionales bacterium]|nr:L,D-transpeptidase family protein [Oligoflexia bacterium]
MKKFLFSFLVLALFGQAPARADQNPFVPDSSYEVYEKAMEALSSFEHAGEGVCGPSWPECLSSRTYPYFKDAGLKAALKVRTRNLTREFKIRGLEFGNPVYIRILKHKDFSIDPKSSLTVTRQIAQKTNDGVLEVWIRKESGEYQLFKQYPICAVEPVPGPKKNDGDEMTPEGFYQVKAGQLNPNSKLHLSFNIGYPNEFDKKARTAGESGAGDEIMVHGDCVTLGCIAMTDPLIEEIYAIMEASLNRNEMADGTPYSVPIHIFPFPLKSENLNRLDSKDLQKLSKYVDRQSSPDFNIRSFWNNLHDGYEYFDQSHRVPEVSVVTKSQKTEYAFDNEKNVPVKRKCPHGKI